MSSNRSLVMVVPGENLALDVGLRFLAGTSARDEYGDPRKSVVSTLLRNLIVETDVRFPRAPIGIPLPIYRAFPSSPTVMRP